MPNPEPAKNMLRAEADADHSVHSSLRASILEHVFLGELLSALWAKRIRRIEVLRSEVDAAGYDLVVACNGVTRWIQLKSSYRGSKTARVTVNTAIADKPGGCIIWIMFDPASLKLGPFLWLGGSLESRISDLGNRIGRHTRGGRGRKNPRLATRVVAKAQFKVLTDIRAVTHEMFGIG